MYQNKYYITKVSGTYAETLETYGLAKILSHIFACNEIPQAIIRIEDEGPYYTISSNITITEEMINNTTYFDAFPYIKISGDKSKNLPGWVIDYESEKDKREIFRKRRDEIYKREKDERKRSKLLKELDNSESTPHPDFDIFLKVRDPKNIKTYNTVLCNVFKNKKHFYFILKEILFLYSNVVNKENVRKEARNSAKKSNIAFKEKVTALQIFNPHQGKGINTPKSNSIKLHNLKTFWIREYLKIIGIYESMIIKDVRVTSKSWDTKYYVIEPFSVEYNRLSAIYRKFKPLVSGNTPLKLDILSILYYTKKLIEFFPEYQSEKPSFSRRLNPRNFVQGFKTAYQKNMGQNKSIANIGYLGLPEFIEISSFKEGKKWIEIIDEHLEIIKRINEENKSTTLLLQHYRKFISTGNWDDFFDFYFDYATLLIKDIERREMYLKAFAIRNLKEVIMTEKKFKPILESKGFQNIAKAIRNATIGAQYAKARGDQRFNIHYGMAQDLKRKSPYKKDLIEYLSEFAALYNAETARYVEHHPEELKAGKVRATIKTDDIEEIIDLIDKYGSSIVGKLLAAYGYALERKEDVPENNDKN